MNQLLRSPLVLFLSVSTYGYSCFEEDVVVLGDGLTAGTQSRTLDSRLCVHNGSWRAGESAIWRSADCRQPDNVLGMEDG
ncbi:hypothetical protein V8D89_003978 [Ganoderma adspersum]